MNNEFKKNIMNEDEYNKIKKCVGCGFCCIKAKCAAGQRLYASADQCPALKWSNQDNRYYCSLMKIPGIIGEGYKRELYEGEGCCCNLNSWRSDVKKRDFPNTTNSKNEIFSLDPIFQIFLHSLAREMISGDKLFIVVSTMVSELEKRNIEKDKIKQIKENIVNCLKSGRLKRYDDFMGPLPDKF